MAARLAFFARCNLRCAKQMSDQPLPQSEIILFQTEDGRTRIQCRLENETIWLTQAQIADLFQTTPQNVTLHLKAIFAEEERAEAATCKDYLKVRSEGRRKVSRSLRHYRLDAILAVSFRVRSPRGTQFRQWATARLSEYLVKGFTMDDERLKKSRRERGKRIISTSCWNASATSARPNGAFIRRCWISTQRAWITCRTRNFPISFSPPCRTRCTGRRMATLPPKSSTSGTQVAGSCRCDFRRIRQRNGRAGV